MKIFPNTIKELKECSTQKMIRAALIDRQDSLTNAYSPTYQEIDKLIKWVNENIPDERLHGK